jgi:hypothetical protein
MRTKLLALVCATTLSLPLFAATDMQTVSFTLDKTSGVTGERVNAVLRVKNAGPDAASTVAASISGEGILVLNTTASPGWTCEWTYLSSATCTTPSLAVGAEAEIGATFLLPPRPDPQLRITGSASYPAGDPTPTNNSMQRTVPVTAAAAQADLSVVLTTDAPLIPESSQGLTRLTVRNDGPSSASNVNVSVYAAERHGKPAPFTATGDGWTCTASSNGTSAQCVRQSLGSGQASTIDLRFPAPPYETDVNFNARVVAELTHDPSGAHAFGTIFIGNAENWHRMLIPVTSLRFTGQPWHVDVRMLVRSDTQLDIAPHPCELISITCYVGPYPLRKQFDAYFNTILPTDFPDHPGAQFLYVRREHRDRIHINARVYDDTRLASTAGSEIPVARDEDFKNGLISLLNVPAGTGYRQMLRVYDTHETDATTVTVSVFADDEITPRVTQTLALETLEQTQLTTSARLYTRPRYAQLDLRALDAQLAGARLLRIEVEPVTPGSRIWAFATATNNETHHVTVLSPQ